MHKPFLVLEDIHGRAPRRLFRIGRVTWTATRYAWLGPLFWCALGVAVAWLGDHSAAVEAWLPVGLAYGVLLFATNVMHTVGHIVAGWLLRAPVASVTLTATRDVTVYVRQGTALPRGARIGRASGGPLLNLLGAALMLAVGRFVDVELLRMCAYFNIAIGVWTLLPIPTLDGSVIWPSILRSARSDAA